MKHFSSLFRLMALSGALLAGLSLSAKNYTLLSPDGQVRVEVQTGSALTYSVYRDGAVLLTDSPIGLALADGTVWGAGTRFSRVSRRSVDETIPSTVYKRSQVHNRCNELSLKAKGFTLLFRAYDDGIAWRFVPDKAVTVSSEEANFVFAGDYKAYVPYVCQHTETLESQYFNSFESRYDVHPLSGWRADRLAFLPVTVAAAGGVKLCLVESALTDYPGMFLYKGEGATALKGVFAPVPDATHQGGHNNLQRLVDSRKDVIAENTKTLPWRGIVIAAEDRLLAESDFTWRLGDPREAGDWSWVRPGKVAWDWWNDWNLYGVDFVSGVNMDTYKYYIDFASEKGIEYVILDEGWSVSGAADLMRIVPEIDLPALAAYAESKGVGLILWAGFRAFEKDMEGVCRHYSAMGIKGWKIDFMDHDDQPVMAFYRKAAEVAARYHMLVDFHGASKPAGLPRTCPNVVNYEGVWGLENMKWAPEDADMVTYDVTIPFTRLVAGPADYTQGAMRNATRGTYHPNHSQPMSQGTRCHQLAEYLVFDAPLTMLCDSPSNYLREPECTEWIAAVPTVWDETVALDGKIGEYVVMARRSGDTWYVGALNGWEPRDLTLDLGFIPAGSAVVFADGPNAHRAAQDYLRREISLTGAPLTIHLAPGGGWVLQTGN